METVESATAHACDVDGMALGGHLQERRMVSGYHSPR